MSRIDFRATENELEQIPLHKLIRGLLRIILWLYNNPNRTELTNNPAGLQLLYKKFKELIKQ